MATCLHPKIVHGSFVPCGKCPVCRQNMRQAKGDRFLLAAAFNKKAGGSNFFITLTYDDEYLPYASAPFGRNALYPCFSKHDIKLFFHYLRRKEKCKYFICSEYGTNTKRPHYHGILLFENDCPLEYVRQLISDCWKNGFSSVSLCNDTRIQYASKYVLKDDYYFLSIQGKVPRIREYPKELLPLYRAIFPENPSSHIVARWDDRYPFCLISDGFMSKSAIDFLNEYIYNDGNYREFFEINGKKINFDTYIKNHLDPSISAELKYLYKSREDEVQQALYKSHVNHSKDDNGKLYPDFSFDENIIIHRERLKQLKKNKL